MTERELPTGWAWTTLGELGSWYGGGTPSKRNPEFWESGTIPWVSPKDMIADVLAKTQDHITDAAVAKSSTKMVPENSVMIVTRSGILARRAPVSLVPFAAAMNQDMKAISPHTAVDPTWLLHMLHSQEQTILNDCRKAGTTVASLDTDKLHGLRVALPPLSEQHRIVAELENHLSRLDAAQATLDQAKKRAEFLTDKATNFSNNISTSNKGEAPPPQPANVVDGDLPRIPSTWSWRRLGEIAEVVGGITKNARTQADEANPLHPYLRVANVQAGHLNLNHITEIRATPKQVEKLTLRGGDVLLNEGGDRDKLGRGWIWEEQIPNCLHQNHVFRARVDAEEIDPRLIAWHANSFGRSWFMRNGRQSVNLASVSLTTTRSFPVPVPPPAEQEAIAERITTDLEAYSRLQAVIEVASARTAALRKSLLRMAFSGELVDQNPDDEPASIALTKIRDQQSATAPSRRGKAASAK